MSHSIAQAASREEAARTACALVPAGDESSECRDTAHRMRVLPRTPAGAAEVPRLGGLVRSRRQRRRERYETGTRDPYDPENLLVALAHQSERRAPAERLLIAILEDAIRSYVRTVYAKTAQQRRPYASARDWIARRDRTWLCSFESICDVLDLEADRIRRSLLAWKLAHRA